MGFHEEGVGRGHTVEGRTAATKEQRVREGRAHAALVFDGATCVGWCQFGPTDELPRIKHRRAYEQGLDALPDWRITCFFVDSGYRRRGVAVGRARRRAGGDRAAGRRDGGELPAGHGGGKVSAAFLHNGTLSLFEHHGFERDAPDRQAPLGRGAGGGMRGSIPDARGRSSPHDRRTRSPSPPRPAWHVSRIRAQRRIASQRGSAAAAGGGTRRGPRAAARRGGGRRRRGLRGAGGDGGCARRPATPSMPRAGQQHVEGRQPRTKSR